MSAALLFNEACDLIEQNDSNLEIIEGKLAKCLKLLAPRRGRNINVQGGTDSQFVFHLLSRARVLLGQLIEWKDVQGAQNLYQQAISTDCTYAEAYTQLGRSIWQLATAKNPTDLVEAENCFRRAISFKSDHDDSGAVEAKKLLIRMLWQNSAIDCDAKDDSRIREAKRIAASLGYSYILTHALFQREHAPRARPSSFRVQMQHVAVCDNILYQCQLKYLISVFSPHSPFWRCHGYNSPTTGFFSYQHMLATMNGGNGSAMRQVVHHLWREGSKKMPSLVRARYGEWWAHCRYHSNGHKMHYDYVVNLDSPDTPRHPIATCIVYLSDDCGGSTLVTDQKIASGVANFAYLVTPAVNRAAFFNGRLLHCVVPAAGLPEDLTKRRVTLMVAFYECDPSAPDYDFLDSSLTKNIDQHKGKPDSAAHYSDSFEWVSYFQRPMSCSCLSHCASDSAADGALVKIDNIVDSVALNDNCCQHDDERIKKRRKVHCRAVDLLDSSKVFTYFEALNSGLVLAKKYL